VHTSQLGLVQIVRKGAPTSQDGQRARRIGQSASQNQGIGRKPCKGRRQPQGIGGPSCQIGRGKECREFNQHEDNVYFKTYF